MTIFIALLQGVNVGKNKRIAMADFREIVTKLGGEHASTIANSGNIVFRVANDQTAEEMRAAIERAVTDHVGIAIPVVVRTQAEIEEIIARNPFPDAAADPKTLHVDFLHEEMPDALVDLDQGNDSLTMIGREIYLYAPNRMSGITYDARTLGKRLGTHHTSRNWNTIINLRDMCLVVSRR